MKTRLGLLIATVALLWGCGTAPDEVRPVTPAPPVTAGPPTVTPVVTPVRQGPTPTPCTIHKLCEEGAAR
jgi:PBP1b-binding outer membrane lipoprotein LpoB